MSKKYYVDGIVCDYGVFYPNETENELVCLCNFKSNAELIADILNTDNEEVSKCWRNKKLDELYQQLAEKDKEIEKWKTLKNARQFKKIQSIVEEFEKKLREDKVLFTFNSKEMSQHDATVRHQICEKIREIYNLDNKVVEMGYNNDKERGYIMITAKSLKKLLDQIEKGE